MYVRTTYVTGDPGRIDEALDALVVEAVKLLADLPGYKGYGLFADRELGKIAMGSWWDSLDAALRSNEQVRERRGELLAPFAATVAVDTLEALAFTQRPEVGAGGCFRLGRIMVPPDRLNDMVAVFNDRALPAFRSQPGFIGAALLADRASGRGSVGTIWADRASLAASRAGQAAARGQAAAALPMTVIALEEFEIVLLDRRD